MPFELAVREGGALGIMTAYNRLNGTFCSEHERLLADVLRGEWGFEGFVDHRLVRARGTAVGSAAGLDLEMPGPGRVLRRRARRRRCAPATVDEALVDAAVAPPAHRVRPRSARSTRRSSTPRGRRPPRAPRARPRGRRPRRWCCSRNDGGVLPLDRVAIAHAGGRSGPTPSAHGSWAAARRRSRPHRRVTPLDALRERLGDDVEIVHEPGCDIDRTVPPRRRADSTLEVFARAATASGDAGPHASRRARRPARCFFGAAAGAGASRSAPTGHAHVRRRPARTWSRSCRPARPACCSTARVLLDGVTDPPPRGTELFGLGSEELQATVELVAGEEHDDGRRVRRRRRGRSSPACRSAASRCRAARPARAGGRRRGARPTR